MRQRIGLITLIVADYDEAIAYYTQTLGFDLVADTPINPPQRWVVVAPPHATASAGLLLAQAADEQERAAIGRQAAGRVLLFLHTDDFARDHAIFTDRGVRFLEQPRTEAYGTVAVFEDLYGNRWDLIQLNA